MLSDAVVGPLARNTRNEMQDEEDDDSSLPEASSTEQPESDCDNAPKHKKVKPVPDHEALVRKIREGPRKIIKVKKIRDVTRSTDDEGSKSDRSDQGIIKFKARKVLTPGARIASSPTSSKNSRPNTEDLWRSLTMTENTKKSKKKENLMTMIYQQMIMWMTKSSRICRTKQELRERKFLKDQNMDMKAVILH